MIKVNDIVRLKPHDGYLPQGEVGVVTNMASGEEVLVSFPFLPPNLGFNSYDRKSYATFSVPISKLEVLSDKR